MMCSDAFQVALLGLCSVTHRLVSFFNCPVAAQAGLMGMCSVAVKSVFSA